MASPDPELASAVAALIDEPLWHVSLGSKELFHSNLLAWMCERFPSRAQQVFEPWLGPHPNAVVSRVRREYKRLDLVIEQPGYAPLVIENKVFALPDEAQLARYGTTVLAKLKRPQAVLLSVADPGWTNGRLRAGGYEWRYLSYAELAARLHAVFTSPRGFAEQIIAHEVSLIERLIDLIEVAARPVPEAPITLPRHDRSALEAARVADGIGKLRGHQVMASVKEAYAERRIRPTRTEVGFSNGQPLLAAFWLGEDGDGVGWQYQGGQWRVAMILATLYGRGAPKARERAAYAGQHASWFDFAPLCEVLGVRDADVRARRARTDPNGFNKYDPDFVYRYRLLPARTSVADFVELAVAYGERAEAWRF